MSADIQRAGWRTPVALDASAPAEVVRKDDPGIVESGPILQFCREHGVTWLVNGAVQHIGGRLRLTSRVVDVRTGQVAFRARIDGALEELFDAQDRLTVELTESLSARGRTEAPRHAGVVDPQPSGEMLASDTNADPPGAALRSEHDASGVLAFGTSPAASGSAPPAQRQRPVRGGGGFAPALGERPTTVVMRTDRPPEIDGRLDDVAWETATHLTNFIQIAPIEGADATEETEVWMAYDSDHLYFAFYAHYNEPGIMRVNRADREEILGDDRMAVLFDPFLDQQRACQFEVNGYGVHADSLVNADGITGFSRSSGMSSASRGSTGSRRGGGSGMSRSGQFGIRGDESWNALFDTGGRLVADGWTAEMRIPSKSLRYRSVTATSEHRWGFQITRIIRGKSEAQSWSPISRGVAGQLTQFGTLDGLSGLSRSRNLEILPEVTGFRLGSLDTSNGAFDTGDPDGEIGLGAKYGITPNLTADITFNPDFSQIESDRPRSRPTSDLLVLSRAAPVLPGRSRDLPDRNAAHAGSYQGHYRSPVWRQADRKGREHNLGCCGCRRRGRRSVRRCYAPRLGSTAQTVLGRARYDLYAESYLGAILTAREFGADYNRVAAVDGRFRLGRTHRLSFLAVASETQDESAGSLSGPALEADFSKQGRNLSLQPCLEQHRSGVPDQHRVPAARGPVSDQRHDVVSVVARVELNHLGTVGDLPPTL